LDITEVVEALSSGRKISSHDWDLAENIYFHLKDNKIVDEKGDAFQIPKDTHKLFIVDETIFNVKAKDVQSPDVHVQIAERVQQLKVGKMLVIKIIK
jgi:hypothetical protein